MSGSIWRWAWHFLRRDAASGELHVLIAALVVAVGSVTAVAFFTDRLQNALEIQANELLGADIALAAAEPLPAEFAARAQENGLRVATTAEFPSMLVAGERNELASVKAVSASFPLRGTLRRAPALFAADEVATKAPEPGTVWLESRLAAALHVDVGSRLTLGVQEFTVAAIVTGEPGRAAGNLFALAPRLLMNEHDVPQTQLITPASRVRYQLLAAGDSRAVQAWRNAITPRLQPGQRVQGIDEARPEVRNALDRSARFLSLAALTSVLLAGVAIAMAVHRYAQRHLDHCAILRCLGAPQAFITGVFTTAIGMTGALATLAGIGLGALAHLGLTATLGALTDAQLPLPSWRPVALGLAVGGVTLLGSGLPPLLRLKTVTPLRVLRRDLGWIPPRSALVYGAGLATFALLVLWQAADVKLGAVVLAGIAATGVTLATISYVAFFLLRPAMRGTKGALRIGWRNVSSRSAGSAMQTVAFGLSLMVLLLLGIVRDDLLRDWLKALPSDAPNRFLINIQPDQAAALRQMIQDQAGGTIELYPMVRGRLSAINAQPIDAERFQSDRARRLVEREFNLSWADTLPTGNGIVAGNWWSESEPQQLSVEEGLANELGIRLGDTLSFRIASQEVTARVTNIRSVQWDSFRVNFFVVSPSGLFDGYPATYITSFYLPPEKGHVLNAVLRAFPNVTVIDVAAMLEQVRGIIGRVTQAVEWVFLFTLAAGIVVFYAALQASWDDRLLEAAMLRTLGATRGQLWAALLGEFAVLGAMAGAVAATGAAISGAAIAVFVFDITYIPTPLLWLIGVVGGGAGIALAGMWSGRSIARAPPLSVLRRLAA